MTLRDILSIELLPSIRIRISAQCEENYFFYLDITEDSLSRGDPLEELSDDILDSNVVSLVAYRDEIYIDIDISMIYIDRNERESNA